MYFLSILNWLKIIGFCRFYNFRCGLGNVVLLCVCIEREFDFLDYLLIVLMVVI